MMKRARYNQSELSNSNSSVFLEYLTTLPQMVEYYNIYTSPYRGGVAPAPPRRLVVGFGLGPIGRALRYHHKSHFLSQSGRSAKLSG